MTETVDMTGITVTVVQEQLIYWKVERSSPLMNAPSHADEAINEAPVETSPSNTSPSTSPKSTSPSFTPPLQDTPSAPPAITPSVQLPTKPSHRQPSSIAIKVTRPTSARSLKSSYQPHLYNDHYEQFERSTPKRSHPPRPLSARPPSPKKKLQKEDRLAVERRDMADAAFEHWKRTKDREMRRRKSEKKQTTGEEIEKKGDEAFKSWLASKSRQKSKQRQTEQLRAKIITSELLSVDYSESEHAFERWLREKNRKKQEELKERQRKCQADREEMKVVLQNLRTRWSIDYKQSHCFHPNIRKAWDKSSLYSKSTLPW